MNIRSRITSFFLIISLLVSGCTLKANGSEGSSETEQERVVANIFIRNLTPEQIIWLQEMDGITIVDGSNAFCSCDTYKTKNILNYLGPKIDGEAYAGPDDKSLALVSDLLRSVGVDSCVVDINAGRMVIGVNALDECSK